MPDTSVQTSEPGCSPSVAPGLAAACKDAVLRLPRKVRLAALGGSLFVAGLVLYFWLFSASATLNLVVRHNLRSAELSVFIDGKLAYTEQISGVARKRFGLFDTRVEGSFSKSLALSAGEHVVQVRLRSGADGFDQTKLCSVNLSAGKDAGVLVTTQRGAMSLAYQGPSPPAANDAAAGYFNSLRMMVITVLGSAVSAAIGFVVQDFLRSRKASCPVQNQNS